MKWKKDFNNEYLYILPTGLNYKDIYDKHKWISVDYKIFNIEDMTMDYITNCINMIERDCNTYCTDPFQYKVYRNLIQKYNNIK